MATDQNRQYFQFYLLGGDEGSDAEISVDIARAAQRVIDGTSVRDLSMELAKKATADQLASAKMSEWRSSLSRALRSELDAIGGDTARAYRLFAQGFVDAVAHQVENDILNEISDNLMTEDDENDEEEDDDEDDEDDDDGGEDEN